MPNEPRVERKARARIALVIFLVIGGAITSVAGFRVLDHKRWVTGARRVTWLGPSGEVIGRDPRASYSWNGCDSPDIGFQTLVHDGAVWTSCSPHPAFPAGAYARIDPGKGEGRISWPLPGSAPGGSSTVGLIPGTGGRLGIVYWARTVNGPLAAGIAGRDGWVRAPELLPGRGGTRFLAGAWVGDALEVVIAPETGAVRAFAAAPVILRLGARERVERRPFGNMAAMCPGDAHSCSSPRIAFRPPSGSDWRFVVDALLKSGKVQLREVAENGEHRPSPWRLDWSLYREVIDNVAHGVLQAPAFRSAADEKTYVMARDGSLREAAPLPPGWRIASAWHHFVVRDGTMSRDELWTQQARGLVIGRRVAGRIVAMPSPEDDPRRRLEVRDETDGTSTRRQIIARAASFSCGELRVGVLLPRGDGGWWLTSPSGCYLALDASMRRGDPLGMAEHLRRRGSLGIDWNEPWHLWMLTWTVAGLPVCILLGIGAQRLAARRRRRPPGPTARAIAISAGVYALTAGYALLQLLPLLE